MAIDYNLSERYKLHNSSPTNYGLNSTTILIYMQM